MPLGRRGPLVPVSETSVNLAAVPVSANHQAVKRGKDRKTMVVMSNFVYSVSAEHQTEERFWFKDRSCEPLLSSTDVLEG